MTATADRVGSVPSVTEHAAELRSWIAANRDRLAPFADRPDGGLEGAVAQERGLLRLLFETGWSRRGWPESTGGLGGGPLLRAVLYDELAAAGIEVPEAFVILETLGPVLVHYRPDLATTHLPAYLAGNELWAQGFSEPEAGSDLASLRTRADEVDGGYRLTGQKIWSTLGQFASHAAVLARTGGAGHRGISLLWVDLADPGVTVRPIEAANGRAEFAEMFFDDVRVPRSNVIGEPGAGWAVAMYLLQFERGMYAWLRQAVLHRRLRETVAAVGDRATPATHRALGAAHVAATTLRARCRSTVARLDAGQNPGAEISVDKILLSTTEKAVFDAARAARWPEMALSAGAAARTLREEWFYSRATSIFGGAVEVQRDIVADRVLSLPRGDRRAR